MAEPTMPELDNLGERHFAFYPAILNIEHNEWLLKRVEWSEIQVLNTKTGEELWIPRGLVGEISSAGEPIMIIGLRRELEYKAGSVWPRERRVLSMPRIGGRSAPKEAAHGAHPAAPKGGSALGAEGKVSRLIGVALLAGLALIVAVVAITQRPVSYKGRELLALQLTAEDTYESIVRKLGAPSEERWRAGAGTELEYQAIRYRDRPYTLVLMGADRKSVHYIGALDKEWKPVHSVRLPGGGDTLALLRGVPKF
ncbi:MAG: hypothetical protein ACE141_03760 [Bryobacteraceae bacterium]